MQANVFLGTCSACDLGHYTRSQGALRLARRTPAPASPHAVTLEWRCIPWDPWIGGCGDPELGAYWPGGCLRTRAPGERSYSLVLRLMN